tara:strand:+ start:81 stop:794 length:714 start_codon:yes stop_codon:yes gene_type:complete
MYKKIFFLENLFVILLAIFRYIRKKILGNRNIADDKSPFGEPLFVNSSPYVHIPKTGGSSLTKALGRARSYHHASLRMMYVLHPKAKGKSPIAFSREPFERFRSAVYFLFESDYYNVPHMRRFKKRFNYYTPENVINFIDSFDLKKPEYFNRHHVVFEKQVDFVSDFSGYINFENIYKISSLNKFMKLNDMKAEAVNMTNYKKLSNEAIESSLHQNKEKILDIYHEDAILYKHSKEL